MYRRRIVQVLAWCLASLLITNAGAAESPDGGAAPATGVEEEIRHAARVWLSNYARLHRWDDAKVEATVAAVHSPAPACAALYDIAPINTDQPSRLMFSVRCPGEDGVTYYQAHATIIAKAVVATAPIMAGKPIDAQAVTLAPRDLTSAPDAIVDPAALAFQVSRRSLKPGQILQARYLDGEKLVQRDQPVLIVAHLGALQVSTTGVAAQDGAKDALIRVRSGTANRVIAARVTGRGTVEPIVSQ